MKQFKDFHEMFAIGNIIARNFIQIKQDEQDDETQKFQPRFRITETKLDRHGDVVMSGGGQLKNWKANPQVFFGHRSWSLPIGMGVPSTVEQTKDFIEVDKIFDDDGTDEFSTLVSLKIQKGFLTRSSIGFMPLEVSEEAELPKQTGITYIKWELLESSVVPIPALVSAGRVKQDEIKEEFNRFRSVVKGLGHVGLEDDIDFYVNKCHIIPKDEAEFLGIDKKIQIPVKTVEVSPELLEIQKQIKEMQKQIDKAVAIPTEVVELEVEPKPIEKENRDNATLIHGAGMAGLHTKLMRMRLQLKNVEQNIISVTNNTLKTEEIEIEEDNNEEQ